MKLGDKERKILSAVELCAGMSAPGLRKKTGLRDHTIRYHLQRFRETGLAVYQPLLDLSRCGLSEYEVFFSLPNSLRGSRGKVVESLKAAPNVIAVHEYVGDYELSITLAVRNVSELMRRLEELCEICGSLFSDKLVSARLNRAIYSRKYLWPKAGRQLSIEPAIDNDLCELDTVDMSILHALSSSPEKSFRDLSHYLKMPTSTFCFRVKRLQESGVILGWRYALMPEKLGVMSYRLLIGLNRQDSASRSALRQFCRAHQHVIELTECLGSWDAECAVEVETAEQLNQLTSDLHQELGEQLHAVRVMGVTRRSLRNYAAVFASGSQRSLDVQRSVGVQRNSGTQRGSGAGQANRSMPNVVRLPIAA